MTGLLNAKVEMHFTGNVEINLKAKRENSPKEGLRRKEGTKFYFLSSLLRRSRSSSCSATAFAMPVGDAFSLKRKSFLPSFSRLFAAFTPLSLLSPSGRCNVAASFKAGSSSFPLFPPSCPFLSLSPVALLRWKMCIGPRGVEAQIQLLCTADSVRRMAFLRDAVLSFLSSRLIQHYDFTWVKHL